ncbi:hypothetical protein LX32DRAFT_584407 [Colletotrichum zoysiae]|uniref:ubiquitinyl hydrolase 1 n=1 Tax=Colletotrichum zoysiae TaxID=1216348 RepID=A0AAD9M3E5_9PEZI|nr:hypothetical protein LX32DRAFT_584407 [Colletotrichum zoysiae]
MFDQSILYRIYHIFLTPQLPQEDDFSVENDNALVQCICDALTKFRNFVPNEMKEIVQVAAGMMYDMVRVHQPLGDTIAVDEGKLLEILHELSHTERVIPLNIRAQNAGVLIARADDSIHFEAFELSPTNEAVITTIGRLRRTFPGVGVVIGLDEFNAAGFQETLAATLAKMSSQPAPETQPRAKKAGQLHDESRDTTNPKMVTELLYSFLQALGHPLQAERIWKNTRDEVNWNNALLPWHRSSTWLLVRVCLQLVFGRLATKTGYPEDSLYKTSMVFIMTEILSTGLNHGIDSDLVLSMGAKLSRRLLKLTTVPAPGALDHARQIMRQANETLSHRWSEIQANDSPGLADELESLKSLDFERDSVMQLPSLDNFLESFGQRHNKTTGSEFIPSWKIPNYNLFDLPSDVKIPDKGHLALHLAAFETWVDKALQSWFAEQPEGELSRVVHQVRNLLETYHEAASSFYDGNPESTSIMLLTILDLWIVCDKATIRVHEMLREYNPDIPLGLFQNLILPTKGHMERLNSAELYLAERLRNCKSETSAPNIYTTFGTTTCFSARHFDQSLEQQSLRSVIEEQAERDREAKKQELRKLKTEYGDLMAKYHASCCDYYEGVDRWGDWYRNHSGGCQRCSYQDRANGLMIEIHEWPLPTDISKIKSTVFELSVPKSFGDWREASVYFLFVVLKAKFVSPSTPRAHFPLENYRGLSQYFRNAFTGQNVGLNVCLLSEDKPHMETHRRTLGVGKATENEVCLENGLNYAYYVNRQCLFLTTFAFTYEIPEQCTYSLPPASKGLQQFIFRPATMPSGPSPNTAISTIHQCPDSMLFEEYKALASIPLGYSIQWMNILIQLSSSVVDFKKTETALVIQQCAYQAGPPNGCTFRHAHTIIQDDSFALEMLEGLFKAIQRFEKNWQSSVALRIFTFLSRRILSLSGCSIVHGECLLFLSKARGVTFSWAQDLKFKAQESSNDDAKLMLQRRALDVYLICADTFNVDEAFQDAIFSDGPSISIFLQSSMGIHEGSQTLLESLETPFQHLYSSWQRTSYLHCSFLARKIVTEGSPALDDAITASWSIYKPSRKWNILSETHDLWLKSLTASPTPMVVQFSLTTGELLVNGAPLDYLPQPYLNHEAYKRLFGRVSLEIMPTPVPGMQFSSKRRYAGYDVHLGLGNDSEGDEPDLLVRVSKEKSDYELIPKRCLKGRLPTKFVDQYVHWWDHEDKCVKFCDINTPWEHTALHWRLSKDKSEGKWKLIQADSALVDVRSQSAKLMAAIFRPLEDPFWIHIVHRKTESSVSVELPRVRLEFNHTPGRPSIHSRQFRGMVIDSDQSVGALVGLKDKLVLKADQSRHSGTPACRKVLVPEGRVSFTKKDGHVDVRITKGASKVQAYRVDSRLAKLTSNNDLQSNLFLCYLHALTSFVIPDPLTKRTGTEQALSILRSASVRSFHLLTKDNMELLGHLAELTPGRTYYPAHERVMQSVTWELNLNFLAQHGLFYEQVKSIFEQNKRYQFFHPHRYITPPKLEKVEPSLLKRDSIRSSTFRVSGFGAETFSLDHDIAYVARDRANSAQASRAFSIASLVFSQQPLLIEPLPANMDAHLWNFLDNSTSVLGPRNKLPTEDILYNAEFLLDSSTFITTNWIGLQRQLKTSVDKHRLMIWLSTLAFSKDSDMAVIQTLALFHTTGNLASISPPSRRQFTLRDGASFNATSMRPRLEKGHVLFNESFGLGLKQSYTETNRSYHERRERLFKEQRSRAVSCLLNFLANQWPSRDPVISRFGLADYSWNDYVRVDAVAPSVKALFETWYDNLQFKNYIGQITLQMPIELSTRIFPTSLLTTPELGTSSIPRFISEDAMFRNSTPPSIACETWILDFESFHKRQQRDYQLPTLLSSIRKRTSGDFQGKYVEDLSSSLVALQQRQLTDDCNNSPKKHKERKLMDYLNVWKSHTGRFQNLITNAVFGLETNDSIESFNDIYNFYQLPRLSASSILQRLNHVHRDSTPAAWTECLTKFGMAISQLQRAERMLASLGDSGALKNELQNPGHTNWSPSNFPDTLLLEIESDIMVREVQESIADKMRSPPDNGNVVMQLNMGEGKSSVIVQMVAAAIADGSHLVRVIVAKPQSKQMFQMMVSKLGGLLNRRVYHMPFSRAVKVGPSEAEAIRAIFQDCMESKGVLLVQPEHLLSFQLMGIETAILGRNEVSASLVRTKDFLDRVSRDIVDESDENFSVKFELVYTMGTQRPIEHSPDRWVCIHQVLDVLRKFLPEVQRSDPTSIEISTRHDGCFPRTRILRENAKRKLFELAAHHLSEVGTKGLPMASQPSGLQHAVCTYILKPDLSRSEIDAVEGSELWTATIKSTLLLLRGLIACQILSFVFCQKRWRVDYGPDHSRIPRTRLAVPYRAKDNPSARSEFSHPEVIIILTSLSYYYGGLDDSEILLSFEHLRRSDQADMEYRVWVQDSNSLPVAFQQLSGINLEDRMQCVDRIFPCFRYAKATVDYFLQHVVFTKEIKEFPHKLSASGWDIGARKGNPTTGFSGTMDSRAFLPLSVKHLDLPDQKPTNALVLEYLLQEENSVALMPVSRSDTKSDAEALLEMVVQLDPPARVILDVGAQILELDNLEVAKQWLQMTEDKEKTQAVIFCDEEDQICVVDRKNRIESLQTSPFANQTDVCLVFLDEAHTRGTDLKLPEDYRAAVTLGAKLTKDRLVQACMRMRKLGKGQSVVFCVPDEIRRKIESETQSHDTAVTVARVLEWSISETFADLQRGIWLWANQGRRYQRNAALWNEARTDEATELSNKHAKKFLEDEAQSIETRYSPSRLDTSHLGAYSNDAPDDDITNRLLQFGGLNPESTTFREEQERELSPEVEQEREVQKPPPATPASHIIHPDVRAFISQGIRPSESEAFLPAFRALADTSAAIYYDVTKFSPGLLVTQDFARTIVALGKNHISDLFQRPVQWILASSTNSDIIQTAIIISPHEAQELLPDIKKSQFVSLHLYAPRPNLGYRALDTLDLYTIPKSCPNRALPDLFLTELNLFSGQLYLKSMGEYKNICQFLDLGFAEQEKSGSDNHAYSANLASHEAANLHQFMRVLLLKIRRNCQSIDKTHLGKILEYRALEDSDFVNNRVR